MERSVRVNGVLGEHQFRHKEGMFSHQKTSENGLNWSPCGSPVFWSWHFLYAVTGDLYVGEAFNMSYLGLDPERQFGIHYRIKWQKCGDTSQS